MAPVLPPSAHVAGGLVYFADGAGVVRSLSVNGQITKVATFPLSSQQQMLSFAVSPDGSKLLGTIFTLPAKPQLGCGGSPAAAGYSLDVYLVQAGGASTLLYHESLPATAVDSRRLDLGINVMALIGWDQVGPIATYPTYWGTQGGLPHSYDGIPVRVDSSTGKVVKQVSPSTCYVQDIVPSGDFLCGPGNARLSVRRPDGSEVWRAINQPFDGTFLSWLSPDEGSLVTVGSVENVVGAVTLASGGQVTRRDGRRLILLEGIFDTIFPSGWLDSTTVIGTDTRGSLSYVALNAPSTMVNIGFKGKFLGTVRG